MATYDDASVAYNDPAVTYDQSTVAYNGTVTGSTSSTGTVAGHPQLAGTAGGSTTSSGTVTGTSSEAPPSPPPSVEDTGGGPVLRPVPVRPRRHGWTVDTTTISTGYVHGQAATHPAIVEDDELLLIGVLL